MKKFVFFVASRATGRLQIKPSGSVDENVSRRDKRHGGKINAKDIELFRNGSVYEFYRLKALIILEQVNTSVVEKKKNKNSMVRLCKLSLFANEACDDLAVYFRR